MIWMVIYTDSVSLQPCVSKAIGVAFYYYFDTVSSYVPLFEWEPLWAIGAIHSFALGRKYPWWSHVHNTNDKQRAIEKTNKQSNVK